MAITMRYSSGPHDNGDNRVVQILFLTWDGPDTTYLEGLFLPVFSRLAPAGIRFHVLQFTWASREIIDRRQRICSAAGVAYEAVRVWRRPNIAFGALLTTLKGAFFTRRLLRSRRIDVVIPRSILPAFAAMLALRHGEAPFVFDADGLPLDERVDFAGLSPSGLVYRTQRDMESEAVRRAKAVLTRSRRAADVLLARAGAGTDQGKFHVVGNGRDSDLFAPANDSTRKRVREELGIAQSAPLLVYAGSLGPQYCLDSMLSFFTCVRALRSDTQLLILTPQVHLIEEAMSSFPEMAGFMKALGVPARRVPRYLASADLGLALRRPSFSMQAVAPIKLGEYLLCGLPVLATADIGDTEETLAVDVAYLLGDCDSPAELSSAAHWFLDQVLVNPSAYRKRCRAFGVKHFSLDETAARYRCALRTVLENGRDFSRPP